MRFSSMTTLLRRGRSFTRFYRVQPDPNITGSARVFGYTKGLQSSCAIISLALTRHKTLTRINIHALSLTQSRRHRAEMSTTAENQPPPPETEEEINDDSKSVSKKAAKKEAAKLEKLRRRQEATAASAAVEALSVEESDPLAAFYGDVALEDLMSKTERAASEWTEVRALAAELRDQSVIVRGRAQTIRPVGKNMAFVVVRERGFTVQCVATVASDLVSRQMVKFISGLSRESIVNVEGIVSVPKEAIKGTTQQV